MRFETTLRSRRTIHLPKIEERKERKILREPISGLKDRPKTGRVKERVEAGKRERERERETGDYDDVGNINRWTDRYADSLREIAMGANKRKKSRGKRYIQMKQEKREREKKESLFIKSNFLKPITLTEGTQNRRCLLSDTLLSSFLSRLLAILLSSNFPLVKT